MIITGNALALPLADESVHCCVTSPPYWGLRDYGTDAQIGLEQTPDEYVARLVAVFREVHRVLRDDGTLWLNLGDSYAGGSGSGGKGSSGLLGGKSTQEQHAHHGRAFRVPPGLPPKSLVGIPWRVAFALQADGWILRSDIIWAKPNPMPESVRDRPTKSHEYLFMLAKRTRYYFDQDAVREVPLGTRGSDKSAGAAPQDQGDRMRTTPIGRICGTHPAGRNIRDVWTIATQPYPGAHFAVMPPALVEPCIKAGTSAKGCCPKCGSPWRRTLEIGESQYRQMGGRSGRDFGRGDSVPVGGGQTRTATGTVPSLVAATRSTTGWAQTCDCPAAEPVSCVVLDPFAGAGTVGLVADRLRRRFVGVELNPKFARLARDRIRDDCPLFAGVQA